MTTKQRGWYLRKWQEAFRAHWAGVKGGEVTARPGRPEQCEHRERVLAAARMLLARGEFTQLSPDAVRMGAHVVALGKPVSSKRLTNRQLDVVIAFFQLLAGRVDLVAQMQCDAAGDARERALSARSDAEAQGGAAPWQATQTGADRKRMLWSIEHLDLPGEYIEVLSRDRFGTTNWRGLDDVRLRQLLMQCKARLLARAAAAPARSAALGALSTVEVG